MKVEVLYLPQIATNLESRVCVVIDVLRATSTLVAMFESGVGKITLAEGVAKALQTSAHGSPRPAVCGEVGGLPPAGFDFGNSPREYEPGSMRGREIVFFTSNGTKAVRQLGASPVVLAGSMLNGTAVVKAALAEAASLGLDLAFVCSGDFVGTRFAIDDAFCAGYLCSLVGREASAAGATSFKVEYDESAVAALRLYRSYLPALDDGTQRPPRESILTAFWESHNALVLGRVGLSEDVNYCAQIDVSTVVPRLAVENGSLVLRADAGAHSRLSG